MPQTILTYTFQPSQVFIATTANLTLIIQNPAGGQPVQFKGGPRGDEIDITFPIGNGDTDLSASNQFQVSATPSVFTCGLRGGLFALRATADYVLQPGASIMLQFQNIVVNGAVTKPSSSASVAIAEYLGASTGNTNCVIQKLPPELGVIAWVVPMTVGLQQNATLFWQSMGGIGVKVVGFGDGTGSKDFKVSGNPPYSDNTKINVPSATESQRTYTLQVYTSDQKHKETAVTLTQMPPVITAFTGSKQGTIGVSDSVVLTFNSIYGSSSSLTTPALQLNNPTSPQTVFPGKDIVAAYKPDYTNLPDTASYQLMVQGFQKPANATLEFKLAPVGLSYFKFTVKGNDGKLSGAKFLTDPATWTPTSLDISTDPYKLTIFQPGGTSDVYYLGNGDTTHPQIQYFDAKDAGNGTYNFNWITANLQSLILNPGNYQITGNDIKNGTKNLTLVDRTYTLTGTGTNGEIINSVLQIPAAKIMDAHVELVAADPSCEVTVAAGSAIPNYYKDISARNRQDAMDAIAQLTFADIWRSIKWRIEQGTVRLDQQPPPSGKHNLQVQVNGVSGKSTIATAIVDDSLSNASTDERRRYVERKVRNALVDSLNTAKMYNVTGSCN